MPQEHRELATLVNEVATLTYDGSRCSPIHNGYYDYKTNTMSLCHVHGKPIEELNEDQLNTLRHESIHLAQDCNAGGIGTAETKPLLEMNDLMKVAVLAKVNIAAIWVNYRSLGADEATVVKEWEAWSSAEVLSAKEVSRIVTNFCKAPSIAKQY